MHDQTITSLKDKHGSGLAILAHHYQSDAIVKHADLVGDSLQLAAAIPGMKARFIVFCGVDFMAETAAVLADQSQLIFSPDPDATCVMANMAPASLVEQILIRLNAGQRVVPLAYVNSSVGVKALCGKFQGSACTSSNAIPILKWALKQGDQVLFLPDKNLGRNTARLAGIEARDIQTLDIRQSGRLVDPEQTRNKKLLLWPGVCAVHFRLKDQHINQALLNDSTAKIVVHPECHPSVVEMAHQSGSTTKIISFVKDAPPASTIYVGTEDNLVHRLKKMFRDKNIQTLGAGYCSNMARTTPEKLVSCLTRLDPERAVKVDPSLAVFARKAVQTMLEVSS